VLTPRGGPSTDWSSAVSTDHATPHDPTRPDDVPLAAVLTCTGCQHTYEPTTEDFAAGRTGCPDPDCGGWVWTSTLTVARDGGGRR